MAQTQTDKKKAILNLETLEARTLFAGAGEVVDAEPDVDIMNFDIDDLLGDDESGVDNISSDNVSEQVYTVAKKLTQGDADKTESNSEICTNRKSYQRYRDHLNAGIVRNFADKPGDPCFKEAKGDFIREDLDWTTMYTWGLMAKYKSAKTRPF
tara:strand:- start:332 stop:793 length:462 start_codon:yes stop_codon:yes gene_type:complete